MFHQRSWLPFTDRHWECGWSEQRFELQSCEYILSEMGEEYVAQGRSVEELTAVPRAIDALKVTLRKRATTEEEKRQYDVMTLECYARQPALWTA